MALKHSFGFLLFFSLLIAFTACNNTPQPSVASAPEIKESRYASVLAKCKTLSSDTLHIYSSFNISEAKQFAYEGVKLDSVEKDLIMPLISKGEDIIDNDIFACYKIAIDDKRTGILARTPSMYDNTSIKFFTLDNAADSITDFVELAEVWGDAGDVLEKEAWLYKNEQQKLTAFLWQMQSHDPSLDDPKNTTFERFDDYILLDVSKSKHDTLSKSAGQLFKTFQQQNRN